MNVQTIGVVVHPTSDAAQRAYEEIVELASSVGVQQLSDSPLQFRFAGGLCLTVPAFVFIFFMRPYLFNAFGVGGK